MTWRGSRERGKTSHERGKKGRKNKTNNGKLDNKERREGTQKKE